MDALKRKLDSASELLEEVERAVSARQRELASKRKRLKAIDEEGFRLDAALADREASNRQARARLRTEVLATPEFSVTQSEDGSMYVRRKCAGPPCLMAVPFGNLLSEDEFEQKRLRCKRALTSPFRNTPRVRASGDRFVDFTDDQGKYPQQVHGRLFAFLLRSVGVTAHLDTRTRRLELRGEGMEFEVAADRSEVRAE